MSAFKCPGCGKTTGGNEKFCIDCGQAFDVVCPNCDEKWRFMFEYKFCPACGNNMKPKPANNPVTSNKQHKTKAI